MIAASSLTPSYFCIQPPLKLPSKIPSSTSDNFHFPIPPLLVRKIILTIPTKTPFFYTLATFHFPTIYIKTFCPASAIQPMQASPKDQGAREPCEDQHCFNLSLLSQSLDSDNRAHNQLVLIAQAQKIGVLQLVASDQNACNWNGKPSNPLSLISSTYCHCFHTLLIPSQELKLHQKPVT